MRTVLLPALDAKISMELMPDVAVMRALISSAAQKAGASGTVQGVLQGSSLCSTVNANNVSSGGSAHAKDFCTAGVHATLGSGGVHHYHHHHDSRMGLMEMGDGHTGDHQMLAANEFSLAVGSSAGELCVIAILLYKSAGCGRGEENAACTVSVGVT